MRLSSNRFSTEPTPRTGCDSALPRRSPQASPPHPRALHALRAGVPRAPRVLAARASALASSLLLAGCGDAELASAGALGQASQPIIGGFLDETTTGVVGLALDLGTRVVGHCSGTLIAPNLVLTARHCVSTTPGTDAAGIVACDTAEFERTFPARVLLATSSPVRPTNPDDPSYVRGREIRTLGDAKVCGFDIALIILERAAPPGVVPIAPRLTLAPSNREPFSTVGYGLTNVDDPTSDGTRQRADGSAVRCTGEECVALSGGSIQSSEWASVDAPICSGDSGGPALDGQGRVFGVASRGDTNCEIAVFGDVSTWAPFIVDTALDAAEAGDYAPPDWALDGMTTSAEGDGGCSLASPSPGARDGLSMATMVLCAAWLAATRRIRTLGRGRAASHR